jgi:hypothetical protein
VGRPDPGAIQWLKQSFLQSAMQRLEWSEAVSKAVLGRHIKQILLLHLGAFDAVMLDELLTAYRQAGVTMIGLNKAMADSVYRFDPDIVWDGELIFLLQVARAKAPRPPAPTIPLRKLSAVCGSGDGWRAPAPHRPGAQTLIVTPVSSRRRMRTRISRPGERRPRRPFTWSWPSPASSPASR